MQVTKTSSARKPERKRPAGRREVRRRARGKRRGASAFPRSPCPIANLLDLVGDKWSLLVVRDLLRGAATYGELATSPEQIPTNILADRLKRLESGGVILRKPYQERPTRYSYELTGKGRDLGEVLGAVVKWARRHLPGTRVYR